MYNPENKGPLNDRNQTMEYQGVCIKLTALVLFFLFSNERVGAQTRLLSKAKENIMKAQYDDAFERLEKYAEKAGTGAEYQYVMYLLTSRQAKSYRDHMTAYGYYKVCEEAYSSLQNRTSWCEEIQLCDTTLTNEIYRCYLQSFRAIEIAPSVNDVEDYLIRFEHSPSKQNAVRLRDELRLEEANIEHTIQSYEAYIKKYKTADFLEVAQDSIFSIAFQTACAVHTIESYKSFLQAYPSADQKFLALERLIDLEWKQAQQIASLDSYKAFLRNYPDSKYKAQATDIIENLEWNASLASHTVDSFKQYLKKYPNGKYSSEANSKLDELYWSYMQEKQTVESIRQFISERPKSPRVLEARAMLEDAIWAIAEKSLAEGDLRAYVSEFSAGKYIQVAQEELEKVVWNRITIQPSINGLEAYIREFTLGKSRSEAEIMLEDLYWKKALNAGNIASLEAFIEKYPISRFKDETLERIHDLRNLVLPYLNNNHKYQLYNVSQSKFVDNNEYNEILPTSAKSFVVRQLKKYGVISKSGEIILPIKFDCMSFDGVLYQAEFVGKIALFDLNGEEICSSRFSIVNRISEDEFRVYSDENEGMGKCGIINARGEPLVPMEYSSISEFKIQGELVSFIAYKNGLAYLMSRQYTILSKGYAEIRSNYGLQDKGLNPMYIFKEGTKYGILNAWGQPEVPANYDELGFISNNLFSFLKAGRRGAINSDNSFILPPGNYQGVEYLADGYLSIRIKTGQNDYNTEVRIYDIAKQKYITESLYEYVYVLKKNVFQVSAKDKIYLINNEGTTLLAIDEFTNSTQTEYPEEYGEGYCGGGDGMIEDYLCYPQVDGVKCLDLDYDEYEMSNSFYKINYYQKEGVDFEVYLDTNLKVINKPEGRFSELLGKDLTFESYIPSRGLLIASDANYKQYVFDVAARKRMMYPDDFRLLDFYPGFYTSAWKDAIIYSAGDDNKALIADKVDFTEYNAATVYSEGVVLYSQGEYYDAISKFRRAIEIRNDYAEAYFYMGLCHDNNEDSYEAKSNFNDAIRLNPMNSYYIETLYNLLLKLNDWDGLLSTARSAIASGKVVTALDYFYMGLAYHEKNYYSDAIQSYTRALELDGYLNSAYNNRGLCQMNLRKYDLAIRDLNTAISKCNNCSNEDLSDFNKNLGEVYSVMGDNNTACKFWQKAYKLNPNNTRYLYGGCK